MKLTPPFPLGKITQPFGANQVDYGKITSTIGHPGIDFDVEWGTPIPYAVDGAVVASCLSKDNPNLMAFRAVNTIYDDADGNSYEIQYGHVSEITARVGDVTDPRHSGCKVGNTGDVYTNGDNGYRLVTDAEKTAGSHLGRHLHFQVRLLKKVLATDSSYAHYLNDGTKRLVLNGYSYAVPNWNNGYNGCISPNQFFGEDLSETIKQEVAVLNTQTDPVVRQGFIKLIIEQMRKYLGF